MGLAVVTFCAFVALCSGILGKPIQAQMVVLGSMSLGESIIPVETVRTVPLAVVFLWC